MHKIFFGFGLFAFCFAVGYSYMGIGTDVISVNRDPAAIKLNFDYSHLTGDRMLEAVKSRLVDGIEIKKNLEGAGISLGHFIFKNEKGEKKLACEEFSTIHLSFVADGASVGGESPIMEVEGRCENSSDLAKINPLLIPIQKILNDQPGDGEFQFREGQALTIRFSNLPESWPHKWILKSVKLTNSPKQTPLIVEHHEIAKYLGHQVILKF